jgi:hypothetical protein
MGTSVQPLVSRFSMRIQTSLLAICLNRHHRVPCSYRYAMHDPMSRVASLPAENEDLFADLAHMDGRLRKYGRTPSLLLLYLLLTKEHSRQRLLIFYLYLSRYCHYVNQPRIFGWSAAGLPDSALARVAI